MQRSGENPEDHVPDPAKKPEINPLLTINPRDFTKNKPKALRFEDHARDRMSERGVSEDEVRAVLIRPDAKRPATRNGSFRYERELDGHRLVVVAEDAGTFTRVISVWWI